MNRNNYLQLSHEALEKFNRLYGQKFHIWAYDRATGRYIHLDRNDSDNEPSIIVAKSWKDFYHRLIGFTAGYSFNHKGGL